MLFCLQKLGLQFTFEQIINNLGAASRKNLKGDEPSKQMENAGLSVTTTKLKEGDDDEVVLSTSAGRTHLPSFAKEMKSSGQAVPESFYFQVNFCAYFVAFKGFVRNIMSKQDLRHKFVNLKL